jgi:hypothetical protein
MSSDQETHYVSATEPSRLMLFGETVAVYNENHSEHTDTVRTSQETHYVSTTEPNRLMLFGETVAVYCENHTEHTDIHLWADCGIYSYHSRSSCLVPLPLLHGPEQDQCVTSQLRAEKC